VRSPGQPTLRAESLRRVSEPLATALRTEPAPAPQVVRALIEAMQPPESGVALPSWLRPAQRTPVRRAAAAIVQHGGALLAAPVGAGKTWMALAVAQALHPGEPVTVLAPAPLRTHWARTAASLGMEARIGTHTAASRGRLPDGGALVLIDESQHLRTASTRRYRHVAHWLVGRRALLLSATPVVNRLDDLAAQLLLAIRDTALASAGMPSIAGMLAGGRAHPALAAVLVTCRRTDERPPARTIAAADDATHLVDAIAMLQFSDAAPVRELLRRVFWRAAASSPAALADTVRRYRRLLQHAADAAAFGRRVDRELIRRFTGADGEQLALWAMLPDGDSAMLDLDDLDAVSELERAAVNASRHDDARIAVLRALLADGRRTIVFTTRRATLDWLRERLGDPRLGWCSGEAAGIGRGRTRRAAVLDWFRSDARHTAAATALAPSHLLTTDVAAEGLDLGCAERVVHYDLPWTDARLEQREGRTARGDRKPRDVVTIPPPAAIADRLDVYAMLARKRALPQRIGIAAGGDEPWLWSERLADIAVDVPARGGLARIASGRAGVLVGYRIDDGRETGTAALAWLADGVARDEPAGLRGLLEEASVAPQLPITPRERRIVLSRLAAHLRERLQASQRSTWQPAPGREGVARLLGRLWEWARRAARDRDRPRLEALHAAMRFVGGGHTAGEAMLVAELARADDAALRRAVRSLPSCPPPAVPVLRLVGAIVFGAALPSRARAATFGRHDALHHAAVRPRRDADRLDPPDPRQLSPHDAGPRIPRAHR